MRNDGELLLAAICDTPHDMTPRLIYADYLEENDNHRRANFIRTQYKLDIHPFADNIRYGNYDARDGVSELWANGFRLHEQEKKLFDPQWGYYECCDTHFLFKLANFRSGFVTRNITGGDTWVKCADQLTRHMPITHAQLVTTPDYNWETPGYWYGPVYYLEHDPKQLTARWRGSKIEDVLTDVNLVDDSYSTDDIFRTPLVVAALLKLRWPKITFDMPWLNADTNQLVRA